MDKKVLLCMSLVAPDSKDRKEDCPLGDWRKAYFAYALPYLLWLKLATSGETTRTADCFSLP